MLTAKSREKESCLSEFALNLSQMPRAKAVISKSSWGAEVPVSKNAQFVLRLVGSM